MKKIFKMLAVLETKGYYYRAIVTPPRIEIKLYLDGNNTSDETNYSEENTEDGRYSMLFNLQSFNTPIIN